MKTSLIAAVTLCGICALAEDAPLKFNNLNPKQTTIENGVITVKNVDAKECGGGTALNLYQKTPVKIVFSGESKCISCSGLKSKYDYSLYMDVTFMDGTKKYGICASFDPDEKGWQSVSKEFIPEKPVQQARLYVLFRNCKGEAQFRNIVLKESK